MISKPSVNIQSSPPILAVALQSHVLNSTRHVNHSVNSQRFQRLLTIQSIALLLMTEVICAVADSRSGPLTCASVSSKAAFPSPTGHGNDSSNSHHGFPKPKQSMGKMKTSTKIAKSEPTRSEHAKNEPTKSKHKRSEPTKSEHASHGSASSSSHHEFPKPKQTIRQMRTSTKPTKSEPTKSKQTSHGDDSFDSHHPTASEPTKSKHTSHGDDAFDSHHATAISRSSVAKMKTSIKPTKSEFTKSEPTKSEHIKSEHSKFEPTKSARSSSSAAPTSSSTPTEHGDTAEKAVVSVSNGMANVGCYADSASKRTFNGPSYTNSTGMTVDQCTHHCSYSGFPKYAGLEAGTT